MKKGEIVMKDNNEKIVTNATVSIDYEKAYEEVSYELHLAKELIEKYRTALLNLALNEEGSI